MSKDSLEKRYFFKLSTNLITLALSFVTAGIIPRGLGPGFYGDFNFLKNFFAQIVGFLDMGTSICFYTKLSQRQGESGLVRFYLYFSGIIILFVLGFVVLASSTSIYTRLWPGQKVFYIYLAAGMGITGWIVQVFYKISDAYGLTVSVELAQICQTFLGVILILLLYFTYQLNLANYFYYHYIILLFFGMALIWIIQRNGYSLKKGSSLNLPQIRQYLREFYSYSHPLFIYALVGLVVGILDRWLLQVFSGSIQQGFYSLSYQIGTICFLFTSAMTPLIMREFSIAFSRDDIKHMAVLFRRYIPMLYSIAAYFSCFIAVQADKVVHIFGGSSFDKAALAVSIMAFYPIHQTYGQLSGSLFYATGQTGLYRNIGVSLMLISLPVTYFLIAPPEKMGLNIGANGLAGKMVLFQFIGVNIQLYYNAKFLNLSFWKYLGHQILSVGFLLLITIIARFGVDYILGLRDSIILSFLLGGFVYTLMVICLVFYLPIIFGLKREDIQLLTRVCISKGVRFKEKIIKKYLCSTGG